MRALRIRPFLLPKGMSAIRALKVAILLAAFASAHSQTYRFLSVPAAKYGYGIGPMGTLTRDANGNLYGTTSGDGFYTNTVFELTRAGKAKVLHTFGSAGDGNEPLAGLIQDKAGNFYGTTSVGGTGNAAGTVFKMDIAGNVTVLYSFQNAPDGALPEAPVTLDDEGNLYGTTAVGGNSGCYIFTCGTVFKVDPAGNETILYRFLGGTDGNDPLAGLIRDSAGNLFGTTSEGGAYAAGTIFKIDASGNETILYSFQGSPDGGAPEASLIQDSAGNFYGTTAGGGLNCGTIFKLDTSSTETVLYRFTCGTDGSAPSAELLADGAGNFYGTTAFGGQVPCTASFPNGCGTIYKLDGNGNKTTLHTFSDRDGAYSKSGLVRDSDGTLYGETAAGGSGNCKNGGPQLGCGVIFQLKP